MFVLPLLMLRRQPALLLWTLWLFAAATFPAALDLAQGTKLLASQRHVILMGAAICAVVPLLLTATRRPVFAHGLPAVIAVACAASLGLTYTRTNPALSGIGRYLAPARETGEPVVFFSDPHLTWWSRWVCASAGYYSGVFPRPVALIDRPAEQPLLDALRRTDGGGAWLVFTGTTLSPQQILPGCRVTWIGNEPWVAQVAHVRWDQTGGGSVENGDVREQQR
jgi:hypothetical protein